MEKIAVKDKMCHYLLLVKINEAMHHSLKEKTVMRAVLQEGAIRVKS